MMCLHTNRECTLLVNSKSLIRIQDLIRSQAEAVTHCKSSNFSETVQDTCVCRLALSNSVNSDDLERPQKFKVTHLLQLGFFGCDFRTGVQQMTRWFRRDGRSVIAELLVFHVTNPPRGIYLEETRIKPARSTFIPVVRPKFRNELGVVVKKINIFSVQRSLK